jgi:hypothetical protein
LIFEKEEKKKKKKMASFITADEPSFSYQFQGSTPTFVPQLLKAQNMNTSFSESQMAQTVQDQAQGCPSGGNPLPVNWMIAQPSNMNIQIATANSPHKSTPFDFESPFLGSADMPANPVDEYMVRGAPPEGVKAPFEADGMPEAFPFAMTSAKTEIHGPDRVSPFYEAAFAKPNVSAPEIVENSRASEIVAASPSAAAPPIAAKPNEQLNLGAEQMYDLSGNGMDPALLKGLKRERKNITNPSSMGGVGTTTTEKTQNYVLGGVMIALLVVFILFAYFLRQVNK